MFLSFTFCDVYLTELWSGLSLCLSDRMWFDELISLWMSVQNLPSWEVVSSFMFLARPVSFMENLTGLII